MAVKGNLKDISLTNLIQMEAHASLTGRLIVKYAEEHASIFFLDGEIVHAELGTASGKNAFYQILAWQNGNFELETGVFTSKQTIHAHWSDLLLGGLRQLDENNALKKSDSNKSEDFPKDLGKLFGLKKINNSSGEKNIIIKKENNMAQKMQEVLADLSAEATSIFASAVVGMDGLPIAEFSKNSIDVETFSAQMTLLIKLIDTTTKKVNAGKVEDYLLTTDKAYLLIRFLGDSEFYLGIGATRNTSSLGKMRLYSRIYAKRLDAILPR